MATADANCGLLDGQTWHIKTFPAPMRSTNETQKGREGCAVRREVLQEINRRCGQPRIGGQPSLVKQQGRPELL